MPTQVTALHHVTIGCTPDDLPALVNFYTHCIGLVDGFRPQLRFPGHWLYASGFPILHLNALLPSDHRGYGLSTIDHVSFRAHGLSGTREWLHSQGVRFSEIPLTGTRLHQVFVHDPVGTKVELTFDLNEED